MQTHANVKLYLATARHDDGDNLDLFVVADCSVEAGQMLIDHWAQGQVDVDQFAGVVVHDDPGLPLLNAVKGVLDWSRIHSEEPQLTYP